MNYISRGRKSLPIQTEDYIDLLKKTVTEDCIDLLSKQYSHSRIDTVSKCSYLLFELPLNYSFLPSFLPLSLLPFYPLFLPYFLPFFSSFSSISSCFSFSFLFFLMVKAPLWLNTWNLDSLKKKKKHKYLSKWEKLEESIWLKNL